MAPVATKQRYGRVQRAAKAAGIAKTDTLAAPKQEVIQEPPAEPKPQRAINVSVPQVNMPAVHLPTNLIAWITLLSAGVLWYVSVMATDVFLKELFGSVRWWTPFAVQLAFSAVERYLFAGMKNWFTIGVLIVDAIINAAGLFIELLPRFFTTGVWRMLQNGTGIQGDLQGGALLFAAVMLGILLAWGNDNMLSLAVSGKR